MNFEHIDVALNGPVATITLNRPSKLNAITLTMLSDLIKAAEWVSSSEAGAVVLRGNGASFSAGVDTGFFSHGTLFGSDTDDRYEAAKLGERAAEAVESISQITVAALHGHVIGGGLVLAAACDLRIAEQGTIFSIPEVDLGIPLTWGAIERLVREIGPTKTKEFVLTCRPFSAEEARQAGFLNVIVEPGESATSATEMAAMIAQKPRFAVAMTKRHIAEVLSGDTSRDEALGLLEAIDNPEWSELRDAYMRRIS